MTTWCNNCDNRKFCAGYSALPKPDCSEYVDEMSGKTIKEMKNG